MVNGQCFTFHVSRLTFHVLGITFSITTIQSPTKIFCIMKKHFSLICMIALSLWFAACNNAADTSTEKADSANEAKTDSTNNNISANTTNEATADFMVKAANGGMMEVELGKIA